VLALTALSNLFVRSAIQPNSNQPQPLVSFILPDSSTVSQPSFPILVAVILPAELSQNYFLHDLFVLVENDLVTTFPLTEEPFFDEETNSLVWLFFGSYDASFGEGQVPTTIPLDLFAYALFEPVDPSLSVLSAYDELPLLVDLTKTVEGEEREESARTKSAGSESEKPKIGKEGEEEKPEGKASGAEVSSRSEKTTAKEAAKRLVERDPELARKVFEGEIAVRAISGAKKNPKSVGKGNEWFGDNRWCISRSFASRREKHRFHRR